MDMMKGFRLLMMLVYVSSSTLSQGQEDSLRDAEGGRPHVKYLSEITLVGRNTRSDVHFLPEVVGASINAGKKNTLIVMENVHGNIVNNTMRQVMSKVPGIHVWESDPSGIQIGIAARGLSPNRSWEFNIRQNGYDISSDPFGYPEAYYTPQLNSVQRIQVVRGSASLQYGPQFGGLVNFILKDGSEATKPFQYETQQTFGSFGLFNTYHAVGGRKGGVHYYAFWDHRRGDGYRANSSFGVNTGFASLTWKPSEQWKARLELTHFDYRSRQPGGLTDAQFATEPRQSLRDRDWMGVRWSMAALSFDRLFAPSTRLNLKLFGLEGLRNSTGFLRTPDIRDSIHPQTLSPAPRRVDKDRYLNAGLEARFLTDYSIGDVKHTFSAGVRGFIGDTWRRQNGRGNTGSSFDLSVLGLHPVSLNFLTLNAAVFAENIFRIGHNLLVVPGVRWENLSNRVDGRIGFVGSQEIPVLTGTRTRKFLLSGIGFEYHVAATELYANLSQAYRPVLFAELAGNPTTDVIDPALRDAKGWNADLGWRGRVKDWLFFDLSIFHMAYRGRVGVLAQQRTDESFYNLRTNVGDSRSRGIEWLVEFSPFKLFKSSSLKGGFILFLSSALLDARYDHMRLVSRTPNGLEEKSLRGRRVEHAPGAIHRAGATYARTRYSFTLQYSHTGLAYSDAGNTTNPLSNGVTGPIPAYDIFDLSGSYRFNERISVRAGVNNLFDRRYFTRRAGGYPGPGILPAESRNIFLTTAVKL